MHIILSHQEQNQPDAYPKWCDLSWFHNCRDIEGDVELHYHDAAEIWLWHAGGAEGVVGDRRVPLYPGVMVYTPAGCQHAYRAHGRHSNTGIAPRLQPWMRRGHLHVEETGEAPAAAMPACHLLPEENRWPEPALLPPGAFLQSACRAQCDAGQTVLHQVTRGWVAVLVRRGRLAAAIDGNRVTIAEPDLLIAPGSSALDLKAETACELAFAIGWPAAREGEGE